MNSLIVYSLWVWYIWEYGGQNICSGGDKPREGFCVGIFCMVYSWHIYSVWPKITKLGVINLVLLPSSRFLNPFGSWLPLANIVAVFSMG